MSKTAYYHLAPMSADLQGDPRDFGVFFLPKGVPCRLTYPFLPGAGRFALRGTDGTGRRTGLQLFHVKSSSR